MEQRTLIRTLLLTDLVGSTELYSRLGDVRTAELLRRHDQIVRGLLPSFGGREIDKSDGFLLLFERPVHAVLFARAFHRALEGLSFETGVVLQARVGIHLGEVIAWENPAEARQMGAKPLEVEGIAKSLAARVMSLAAGGQTLLTRSAFDLARSALVGEGEEARLEWLAHGAYHCKGIDGMVEVFEAGCPGEAPLTPPPDSEKARRAVHPEEEAVLGWRPGTGKPIPGRENWLLEKRLGEGGFGEVWLGRHCKTGESHVFKFCFETAKLKSLKKEVAFFRLLKEGLDGTEGIARVLDWRFNEPPFFLESEYLEGGSLPDYLMMRGGVMALSMEQRLAIARQVAHAMDFAHSKGVLHRDLKPSNVLVREVPSSGELRVLLADFGVGQLLDRALAEERGILTTSLSLTASDIASPGGGSRLYLAPEIMEGQPATVQSDIYSFGVLLYHLITGDLGRMPGVGWERDVPDGFLRRYIERCLDRDPAARFPDFGEVVACLDRYASEKADTEARETSAELRRGVVLGVGTLGALFLASNPITSGANFLAKDGFSSVVVGGSVLTMAGSFPLSFFVYGDIHRLVFRRLAFHHHDSEAARDAAAQLARRVSHAFVMLPCGVGLVSYLVARWWLAGQARLLKPQPLNAKGGRYWWNWLFGALGAWVLIQIIWLGLIAFRGGVELAALPYPALFLGLVPQAIFVLVASAVHPPSEPAPARRVRMAAGIVGWSLLLTAGLVAWKGPVSDLGSVTVNYQPVHPAVAVEDAQRATDAWVEKHGLAPAEPSDITAATKVEIVCLVLSPSQGRTVFIAGDFPELSGEQWQPNRFALTRIEPESEVQAWHVTLDTRPMQFKFTYGKPGDPWETTAEWIEQHRNRHYPGPSLYRTPDGGLVYLGLFGFPPPDVAAP